MRTIRIVHYEEEIIMIPELWTLLVDMEKLCVYNKYFQIAFIDTVQFFCMTAVENYKDLINLYVYCASLRPDVNTCPRYLNWYIRLSLLPLNKINGVIFGVFIVDQTMLSRIRLTYYYQLPEGTN